MVRLAAPTFDTLIAEARALIPVFKAESKELSELIDETALIVVERPIEIVGSAARSVAAVMTVVRSALPTLDTLIAEAKASISVKRFGDSEASEISAL